MARVSEAKQIEQDNEQAALASFQLALEALPDPRRRQGMRYPLQTVVVSALLGMICGADDAEALEYFGEANSDWLATFLSLPHGAPTQDVFLHVFAALDPAAFSAMFRAWADLITVRLRASGKHIAIDGKTSRRSFDGERPAIHTVSAWLCGAGLVLGQQKTRDKSNEITAIPELLRTLNLKGATVTIDAAGTQTEIAKTIVEGGGHYVLAVKDNQPTLRSDLERLFAEVADERRRSVDELARPRVEVFEESDKGHGRVETRKVSLSRDLDWLTTRENWSGLQVALKVERERTIMSTGECTTQTMYYIGSDATLNAKRAAKLVRRHWSIETELHWVLDMAFDEDQARHRAHNCAQNMTTLRHFALNVIKQDKARKLGVKNSRKRAGWDRSYLLELLMLADA